MLGAAAGCSKSDSVRQARVNEVAPNFTLKYYGAAGQMSLNDLRGKVVLVNFWASWCPPCRSELPGLVALYDQYHDRGFEVLGVVVNSQPEEVDQIIAQFRIPYRSVTGNDGVAQMWQVSALPTTYILDKDGVIRYHYLGARPRATFERDVVRLLAN